VDKVLHAPLAMHACERPPNPLFMQEITAVASHWFFERLWKKQQLLSRASPCTRAAIGLACGAVPDSAKPDRRSAARYQCEVPVALRRLHDPTLRVPALSRDIASGGIFLYTHTAFPVGEETVITLKLPRQDKKARLLGIGRVVRVEEAVGGSGLAVTIEHCALF
jgi:hypothetical protein